EVAYALERSRRDETRVAPPTERGRFEQILDRHHRRLRRVAAGMLGDPDRLDDVLQEAYLRAYRRLPKRFANEAHEATWRECSRSAGPAAAVSTRRTPAPPSSRAA